MENRTSHLTKLDQILVGGRKLEEKQRGKTKKKKNEREAPPSL